MGYNLMRTTRPINTVSRFIPGILMTTTDVPQEAWRRDLRMIVEDLNCLSVGINPPRRQTCFTSSNAGEGGTATA
ncbi:hypothetical protein E4U28_000537 [Claviceps purpurea]|nr:hypothetical protein E4U28_000537 [Claviceps purpurea]